MILEMVRANGAVSLRELARVVQTSEVTVRRDVRALEAEGLLDRRHGGAGTTTQELARRLARVAGLTVVTNSLLVAQALAHANRVEVVMTGGTLRGTDYALVGSGAEQSLQGLRVSRAFLSGSGLTSDRGLSTANMLSASVDRALVQSAAEVVVLADHTKLGTDTMFQTVAPDLITRLVTDEPAPGEERAATELQALADQGVHISLAGPHAPAPRPRTRDVGLPGQRRAQPPTRPHTHRPPGTAGAMGEQGGAGQGERGRAVDAHRR
ncbi:DeoR/GlpR family DNA-binding transcription regulator [Streptomyces sp. NEAU-H3]|uniref:DeoR/GlpR family DNA-binding transcription regulator n=1 Tax=Streptomyces sp. NEAU-H3 TaxID=2720636 RepID=UPI00143979A8|nr:DeoR/GlpR family DNA-binding transcription regulator [Streptomyces sp. NEAU-H3]NJA58690.1 DeoR/GlpR transcriptional regulator [Streptomyces sp. NEAU-H3]